MCWPCYRSHRACDGKRPCSRCIASEKESECRDPELSDKFIQRPKRRRTSIVRDVVVQSSPSASLPFTHPEHHAPPPSMAFSELTHEIQQLNTTTKSLKDELVQLKQVSQLHHTLTTASTHGETGFPTTTTTTTTTTTNLINLTISPIPSSCYPTTTTTTTPIPSFATTMKTLSPFHCADTPPPTRVQMQPVYIIRELLAELERQEMEEEEDLQPVNSSREPIQTDAVVMQNLLPWKDATTFAQSMFMSFVLQSATMVTLHPRTSLIFSLPLCASLPLLSSPLLSPRSHFSSVPLI